MHCSAKSVFKILFLFSLVFGVYCKRNNAEDLLTIHVIPHSHCDPGWLQTYEGYFNQYVDHILTGVVKSLENDPEKTFVWAEISFFKLWWEQQDITTKNTLKRLVENEQFEFVGGGWVQNDEAASSIDIVINQVTEGHEYLLRYFNTRPRIAWQIDPFGHSSLTPTIFSQVGYEALVINRIHHQLKSTYKDIRSMEFMWRPSENLGTETEMFTHVLHTHYSAPQGFDWEEGQPSINDGSVRQRAELYASIVKDRAKAYRTRHLLVPFGDDFKFQRADTQFQNMDALIAHINKNSDEYGIKVVYSTLSRYFDAVRKASYEDENIKFPVYHGDFFPYADNEDSYWTGYYTSRPALKEMIRETLSILRSADIMYAFNRLKSSSSNLDPAWDRQFAQLQQARWDTSLCAHHDSVTGTARSFVVADYMDKLNAAHGNCESVIGASAVVLLAKPNYLLNAADSEFAKQNKITLQVKGKHDIIDTRTSTLGTNSYMLVFENSLAWNRNQYVSIRTSTSNVDVKDSDGDSISIQVNPVWSRDAQSEPNEFQVFFEVNVPPLGLSAYYLGSKSESSESSLATSTVYSAENSGDRTKKTRKIGSESVFIENDFFKITAGEDGFLKSIHDINKNQKTDLSIKYSEYQTYRSGAYIFRSEGKDPVFLGNPSHVIVTKGKLVEEIQIFTRKALQIVRLYRYKGEGDAGRSCEITHVAGNIDTNRELVVRYETNMKNDGVFYTDNGVEMRHRRLNENNIKRPETNYFPIQSTITIRDESDEMAILSRQVMGGSSGQPGTIEMMLHRSLGQDDGRGLSEAMTDSTVVEYKQILLLDEISKLERQRRKIQITLEHSVRVACSDAPHEFDYWKSSFNGIYEPLSGPLPDTIHLQKLEVRDGVSDEISVNFMNFYEAGYDDSNSSPTVNLQLDQIFSEFSLKDLRKVTLSHMLDPTDIRKYNWPVDESQVLSSLHGLPPYEDNGDKNRENQNSKEDGVFVSKSALENEKNDPNSQNSKEEGVFVSKSALDNKKNKESEDEVEDEEPPKRRIKREDPEEDQVEEKVSSRNQEDSDDEVVNKKRTKKIVDEDEPSEELEERSVAKKKKSSFGPDDVVRSLTKKKKIQQEEVNEEEEQSKKPKRNPYTFERPDGEETRRGPKGPKGVPRKSHGRKPLQFDEPKGEGAAQNQGGDAKQPEKQIPQAAISPESAIITVGPIEIKSAFLYLESVNELSNQLGALLESFQKAGKNISRTPESIHHQIIHDSRHKHELLQGGVEHVERKGGDGAVPNKEHPSVISKSKKRSDNIGENNKHKGERDDVTPSPERPKKSPSKNDPPVESKLKDPPKIDPYLAGQHPFQQKNFEGSKVVVEPEHKDLGFIRHKGEFSTFETIMWVISSIAGIGLIMVVYKRLNIGRGKGSHKGRPSLSFTFNDRSGKDH